MKKRIVSLVLLGVSVLTVTACAVLQAQSQRMAEKIIRLQGAVAGLNRSSRPEGGKKADGLRDILTALLAMREEWRHANCP